MRTTIAALGLAALGLAALICGASPLTAQSATDSARAPHFDASVLRPIQLAYQTTLERDAGTSTIGTRTVTLSQATYAGTPAWLLVETRTGDGTPAIDSLFTDLALHPIHWGSVLGQARVSAEFRADSAFGGVSAPMGRRSIVTGLPPGTFINGPMLETVLRLLPLQTAWEDSASTLTVNVGGMTALPTRLSVIGDDRVRVPAGQFDCWVVSVRAGDSARGLYWVSKRDPIVVRSALDVPALGGAQLVSAVTRVVR
jgi:hypothetical protein